MKLVAAETAEACALSSQGAASDRLRQAEQRRSVARASAPAYCHLPGQVRLPAPFLQSARNKLLRFITAEPGFAFSLAFNFKCCMTKEENPLIRPAPGHRRASGD